MDAAVQAFATALQQGGWAGVPVILAALIFAFWRRSIRTEGEVNEVLSERDKRYEEMKADRDYWRSTAQSTLKSLEQLTEVMEGAQNRAGRR